MSEWQAKFNEWWDGLALREQRVVALGGIAVFGFIFYTLIWSPYLDRVEAMRKQIQTESKTLAWMKMADEEIRQLENQVNSKNNFTTPVALLSVLQKQIDQAGLTSTLLQLKQSTQDSVEMHFQKVGFDQLMELLMKVIKEQNISIAHFSATADTTPGMVKADVVIKLGQ